MAYKIQQCTNTFNIRATNSATIRRQTSPHRVFPIIVKDYHNTAF